jgi:Carboxypeptidase regulatory-like domain
MRFSKLNYLLILFTVFFYTGAFGQSSIESPNYTNRFVVHGLFSQTKESSLLIIVKDQFDGVITTAQISVTKIGSDNKIQVQTDDSGTAKIRNLVDGEFQISVSAAGFKEYKGTKIRLKSGSTIRLDVTLEIASIESNVNVSESESVDSDRSTPAVVLNERDLNNLPDKQEDFERALLNLAGSTAGEELPISVNGVEGAKIPPKQAIKQVRINQNVYSAQFDSPSGSGTDIFTRAKVDKFSGSIGFNFADSRFDASNPFLGSVLPSRSREYSFNLSGPIGKESNFYIYSSRNENDQSAVINASIIDADLQPTAFKQSFATPARSNNIYLNINLDITEQHKLFFSGGLYNNHSNGGGVGNFTLPSRAADTSNGGGNFQFSDTYLRNSNFVSQTAITFFSYSSQSRPMTSTVAIDVSEAFFSGGSTQDFKTRNLFFQASNQTTWQRGKYTLGFGGRFRANSINQNSQTNFNGNYIFSGRLAPILDAANKPITDAAGNYATEQISSLESYRRTLLFQQLGFSNQRIRELGGGANQFTISGGNPKINLSQYDYAFYAQNSYKLTPTIAVSFGLRYEDQNNIKDHFDFAPRLGIIWAPKAKDKQNPLFSLPRISAGYGIFYSRFPLSNTLSVRLSDDADRAQYLITDPVTLDLYPHVPSLNLLEQFAVAKTQRFIDNKLKAPAQSLLTVAATKKLFGGFSLNLSMTTGKTFRQIVMHNFNAPLGGAFNPLNPQTSIRPSPEAGNIYGIFSNGKAKKTRLSAQLQFPNEGKLYSYMSYSFVKSKNNVVSGSGAPFDPYDFSQEFAPGTADGMHSLNGYSSYQLPYGFSVGGSYTFHTGGRFNIFTGRDTNGDGFFNERPALATDLSKPGLIQTKYGILDPNPAPGATLIPRNLGRGSRYFSVDANISKTIGFGGEKAKKKSLNFSMDIYNLFNTINRADPIGNMSSPNFLQVTNGVTDNDSMMINEGYFVSYGSGVSSKSTGRHFGFGVSYRF